jgi:hypothetical protein
LSIGWRNTVNLTLLTSAINSGHPEAKSNYNLRSRERSLIKIFLGERKKQEKIADWVYYSRGKPYVV